MLPTDSVMFPSFAVAHSLRFYCHWLSHPLYSICAMQKMPSHRPLHQNVLHVKLAMSPILWSQELHNGPCCIQRMHDGHSFVYLKLEVLTVVKMQVLTKSLCQQNMLCLPYIPPQYNKMTLLWIIPAPRGSTVVLLATVNMPWAKTARMDSQDRHLYEQRGRCAERTQVQ